MKRFLGVLGGMGPLATSDFLARLTECTPAATDQEHIPVIVYGDCTTPDRTAHVLGEGSSPLPQLLKGIEFLNKAGVGAICVPCNSAHVWFPEMKAAASIPVLHIVEATAKLIRRKNPGAAAVGILSTLGTHRMGIYRDTLETLGFATVVPSEDEFGSLISPGIACIKANRIEAAEPLFELATQRLRDRGAAIIALGCTEIPIGMRRQSARAPSLFVDSTEALALAAVDFFRNRAD